MRPNNVIGNAAAEHQPKRLKRIANKELLDVVACHENIAETVVESVVPFTASPPTSWFPTTNWACEGNFGTTFTITEFMETHFQNVSKQMVDIFAEESSPGL